MRRLFWDCETSPNICLSWRVGRKINLDSSNILKERAMISLAYKWQGERKVRALAWDSKQCDKTMLIQFAKILAEADEIIAWYGDSFDMRWFRTRCLFHGVPILNDYKTVDPMKWARSRMMFNSCKLDYVAQYLGVGAKLPTEFDLWKKIVLNKDASALRRMVRYNQQDVVILERVYDKLVPTVPAKTHLGVMSGNEPWSCPVCASTSTKVTKTRVSAKGAKSFQLQCNSGHYYTIGAASHKAYLEK